MKKNVRLRLSVSIQLVCMTIVSSQIFADGYRNPPPTAEGIAKGGANSVFVDDASAISYNPANLGMQTDRSLVVAATWAKTVNEYAPAPGVTIESDNSWHVLPNIFYAQAIGLEELVVVGLGITTPYGQGSKWNAADLVGPGGVTDFVPYEADVMLINFNPGFGFKMVDRLYFGAGLDIVYSELTLKALAPSGNPAAPISLKGEGDGWGVGANAGLTWLPTDHQRLAVTYRSRYDINYSGDTSLGSDFETEIRYPNSVGFGYGVQFAERFEIEALVEWIEWSINESQTVDIGGPQPVVMENNWDDTVTFSLGSSCLITDALTLRAGYSYIPSPIPDESLSPLLVDADRHVLGIGAGYAVGRHRFDLSYAFSLYDDRTSPITGGAPGAYEIDSNLLGMTYSLNF